MNDWLFSVYSSDFFDLADFWFTDGDEFMSHFILSLDYSLDDPDLDLNDGNVILGCCMNYGVCSGYTIDIDWCLLCLSFS